MSLKRSRDWEETEDTYVPGFEFNHVRTWQPIVVCGRLTRATYFELKAGYQLASPTSAGVVVLREPTDEGITDDVVFDNDLSIVALAKKVFNTAWLFSLVQTYFDDYDWRFMFQGLPHVEWPVLTNANTLCVAAQQKIYRWQAIHATARAVLARQTHERRAGGWMRRMYAKFVYGHIFDAHTRTLWNESEGGSPANFVAARYHNADLVFRGWTDPEYVNHRMRVVLAENWLPTEVWKSAFLNATFALYHVVEGMHGHSVLIALQDYDARRDKTLVWSRSPRGAPWMLADCPTACCGCLCEWSALEKCRGNFLEFFNFPPGDLWNQL